MPFLINLHITMFYALLIAGTICTFWGLGLFIARYQAMKKVALEAESSKEPKDQEAKDNAGSTPAATDAPARSRPPLISPLFRSALRVTSYLALLQGIIGGLIYFFLPAYRPADQLHYVYGILVLLAIPVAFIYMSGKPERLRRDMLILILAALVVAAAAVRAAMTGGLF
jgi:hypothetical protein